MKTTNMFLKLCDENFISMIESIFDTTVKLAKHKKEESNIYFLIDSENNKSLLETAELSAKIENVLDSEEENILVRNTRMFEPEFVSKKFDDTVVFSKGNIQNIKTFLEKYYLSEEKKENQKENPFSFKNMALTGIFSNEKGQPTLTSPREIIKGKLKNALSKTLSEEDKENIKKMSPEEIKELENDFSTELLNIRQSQSLKIQ